VTIPFAIAERVVERFSNGVPRAKIQTNLDQLDLEVGDFVTVDDDVYLNFNAFGVNSTIVWEIISKEIEVIGDSPGIGFTLAWVRDNIVPSAVLVPGGADIDVTTFIVDTDEVVTDNLLINVENESEFLVTV